MEIPPGQAIRLKPAAFKRVPFSRNPHLRGKVGKVRRVIGRECILSEGEGWDRVLLEIEFGERHFVAWDYEVKAITQSPTL